MVGLTCNRKVTLVHHVRGEDTDTYECHIIDGVSWYEKMQVSTSGDGAKPSSTVISRIPEDKLPMFLPEISDYLVLGAVEAISRPSDLRGMKYFRITSVSDNRHDRLLPHVRVSGS